MPTTRPPRIIELRQYTLRPGQRDTLIELFEREFIETQEAVGARVIGTFRDLDDPDRFVWLRGFADMRVRAEALAAFYGGPTWQQHREAANATMIDSANVLLLRPTAGSPALVAASGPRGLVIAGIWLLAGPPDDELIGGLESGLRDALAEAGAHLLATLVTESAPNDFPRLPVREGVSVLAGLVRFDSVAAFERNRYRFDHLARLTPPEVLRLVSTRRSLN